MVYLPPFLYDEKHYVAHRQYMTDQRSHGDFHKPPRLPQKIRNTPDMACEYESFWSRTLDKTLPFLLPTGAWAICPESQEWIKLQLGPLP